MYIKDENFPIIVTEIILKSVHFNVSLMSITLNNDNINLVEFLSYKNYAFM